MYYATVAAAALHQVLLRSLGEDKVVAQNGASGLFCVLFVLGCYCFGVLVWTGSLLVDQAGLIARNETSIERVKKTWRGRANPHDRGAFQNWLDFCFRATPSVVLELDQVESRCEAA